MHSELASNSIFIPVSGRAGSKRTMPYEEYEEESKWVLSATRDWACLCRQMGQRDNEE